MRSVWKGFVIGGITGAAVGLMLDLMDGVRQGAAAATELTRERGPQAASALAARAAAGADRARQADLPGKVRDAAQTAAASDPAQTLRQRAATVADAAAGTAKDAVGKARQRRGRN